LLRVTRPGGYLYLTFTDQETVTKALQELKGAEWAFYIDLMRKFDQRTGVLTNTKLGMASVEAGQWGAFNVPQVIYHADYLREHWGRWATCRAIARFAYNPQHAAIFQK
jgi:hypothetical protein